MTLTLRARFDGKVLVPEQPVSLPVGEVLEIEVHLGGKELSPPEDAYAPLYQLIGLVERGPEDASIHHDFRPDEPL
ncbi:MAG: hypothetical protein N2554_02585 [Fimbriimonadales bacterium]|nr:hypothetical protein [Fimbriimonadales bacterium]